MADPKIPIRSMGGADDPMVAAGVLLPTFLVTYATLVIACESPRIACFWPANAVVLSLLLQMPARTWWKVTLPGGLGLVAARLVAGCALPMTLSLSAINLMEILLCASALRAFLLERLELKRPTHLAAFLLSAGALAPLSSAACAAGLLSQSRHEPFLPDMASWYIGDALGLVVATPFLLMLSRSIWRTFGVPSQAPGT